MAQTNFTPLLIYSSSTAAAVPLAANLTNSATGSELAINIADKNLFFKDSANAVNTVPIRQSSTSSNGWLSSTDWNTFNNKSNTNGTVTSVAATVPSFLSVTGSPITTSGTLALTYSGTALPIANGGTGLTSFTANQIHYGSFSTSSGLVFDGTSLGVGTSSPSTYSAKLATKTANQAVIGYFGGTTYATRFGANATYATVESVDAATGVSSFQPLQIGGSILSFAIGGTEQARIDANGNLLIATTNTSAGAGAGIKLLAAGNGASNPLLSIVQASSTNAEVNYSLYSTGAAAYRFYVGGGGTIFATSVVISAISDERLKENIKDIDTGIDTVMALKPRRFDWKEGKGQDKKNVAGFIAQEFEEVFPECVGTTKAGADGIEYKNINHETLIPTLVKAIQEQQVMIQELKTRLNAL